MTTHKGKIGPRTRKVVKILHLAPPGCKFQIVSVQSKELNSPLLLHHVPVQLEDVFTLEPRLKDIQMDGDDE